MSQDNSNHEVVLEKLQEVFCQGANTARDALKMMMHRNLDIQVVGVKEIPFGDVSAYRYPADVPVAMIIIRLQGEGNGFLAFVMFEESARKVNEILWEEIPDTVGVLNLSNVSAIKEMGNIVGSCFLNQLANSSGVEIRPGEPVFVYDLMAAIMEVLLLEQSMTSDMALLVDTEIRSAEEGITLDVLFFPSSDLLARLSEGLLNDV